jgi:hypothetical protein
MAAYILCVPIDQYPANVRTTIFDHLYGGTMTKNALVQQAAEARKLQRDHPEAKVPKRHVDWDRITSDPLSQQDQTMWNNIHQRIEQAIGALSLGDVPSPPGDDEDDMDADEEMDEDRDEDEEISAPVITDEFVHAMEVLEFGDTRIWRPVPLTDKDRSKDKAKSTIILPVWVQISEDLKQRLSICISKTCETCAGQTGHDYLTDQEKRWIRTRGGLPPQFWQRHKDPLSSLLTDAGFNLMKQEMAQGDVDENGFQLHDETSY